MAPDRIQFLRERYPYFIVGEIPGGTYPGADEPIQTAAIMNWVVGMADLPEEVADGVLRLLTDDREALAQVHEMVDQIDMARLREAPIRLHQVTQNWVDLNIEQQ